MRWCQLSDRFLLPQYKQGHAFSGHAAPHGPGAAREVGREGRSERGRGRWGESLSCSGWSKGGRWDKRFKQSQLADMLLWRLPGSPGRNSSVHVIDGAAGIMCVIFWNCSTCPTGKVDALKECVVKLCARTIIECFVAIADRVLLSILFFSIFSW